MFYHGEFFKCGKIHVANFKKASQIAIRDRLIRALRCISGFEIMCCVYFFNCLLGMLIRELFETIYLPGVSIIILSILQRSAFWTKVFQTRIINLFACVNFSVYFI